MLNNRTGFINTIIRRLVHPWQYCVYEYYDKKPVGAKSAYIFTLKPKSKAGSKVGAAN